MATKECLECGALSPAQRPATPRPIDPRSGPRSPRCHTHEELKIKRRRKRQTETYRVRQHGMDPDQHAELLAFQGGHCPCGNRVKHIDHDHAKAAHHSHPNDQGCKLCWRGLLCHTCNSDILGRGYDRWRLLALVAYLDKPPALELYQLKEVLSCHTTGITDPSPSVDASVDT